MHKPPPLARIRFFQNQVHHENWKNSMAGKNEEPVIKIIESLGYTLGKDFVRQYPIGEKFVMDFAFVNEQVSVEVDGESHKDSKQKRKDEKRDKYLHENNWVSIRIKDEQLKTPYQLSFYKNLIRDIVEERREQWIKGSLYAVDVPYYVDEDYE